MSEHKWWIAVDGFITILTTTEENRQYFIDKLEGQSKWEWGYFERLENLDEQQTKDFIKEYMADDDEDLSSD